MLLAFVSLALFGSVAVQKGPTVLVGSPKLTLDQARALVGDVGRVSGRTGDGFFSVELGANQTRESAIARLSEKVRFVFDPSASQIDRRSLPSVKQHIAYVKARSQILGEGRAEARKSAGFYEALAFYLEPRVGLDGRIDQSLIERAVQQRELLPIADFGRDPRAPVSGFSYAGPRDLAPPYRQFFGTGAMSGRINGIGWSRSNPNVIYAASAGGGVWRSTDQGATWAFRSQGWTFQHATCVAVHPTNANAALVGTGDYYGFFGAQTMGIMRTTNGGLNWTQVGRSQFGNQIVTRILYHPDNPNMVLALTAGASGDIWRSTDAGVTWSATNAPAGNWDDIDYGPLSGSTRQIYAVGGNGESGGRIARSTDLGATWTILNDATSTTQAIMDVACSKLDFGKVFVLHPNSNTIFRSVNGGSSWTNLNLTSEDTFPNALDESNPLYNWSQDTYDLCLETSRYNDTEYLWCGLITLAVSRNDGDTWYDIGRSYRTTSRIHNDQHSFTPHPTLGYVGLVGNDGGIYRVTYIPGVSDTIVSVGGKMATTQFYHMSVHPTLYNEQVMGGTQDNASPASRGDMLGWVGLQGGDGGWSAFQPSDPAKHVTTSQNGSIYRYSSLTDMEPSELAPAGGWQSVNFIAPVVYAGTGRLLIGANRGVQRWIGVRSWLPSSPADFGSQVRTLSVGLNNRSRVYAGCNNGRIWRSDDEGETFTRIDLGPLPGSDVGAIACSWTNSTDVLVGFQSPTGGLFRCEDTLATTPIWTPVSGAGPTALPQTPINAIIRDPLQSSVWYVGTDIGAFMTTDSGLTWQNMNPLFLDNVHVNAFAIPADKSFLYVATFGRGIWRIPLQTNEFTSFTLSRTEVFGGESISGTVQTSLPAPPGTSVQLATNSSYLNLPQGVVVPVGSKTVSFTIGTDQVFSSNRPAVIFAKCLGTTRYETVVLKPYPYVSSFVLAKSYLYGGTSTTGTATLSAPAPFVGSFDFSDNSVFVQMVTPVTIAAGDTTRATVISTTQPAVVESATLTAAYRGTSRTATLTVFPLPAITKFEFIPNPLIAGFHTSARVEFAVPVPITTQIQFAENSPYISLAGTRTVQAGVQQYTIQVYGSQPDQDRVIPATAVISGSSAQPTAAELQLFRSELKSASSEPNPIRGGRLGVFHILINRPLPVNKAISLTSSNQAVATVPRAVTLVAGAVSTKATITTFPVTQSTSVILTASYFGTTATSTLVVNP
jgi:photosystem II stability/assembly factor-like uncharacterized protein